MTHYRLFLRLLRCYHHETEPARRIRLGLLILRLAQ